MRARSLNSFGSRRKGKAGEIIKQSKPLLGEDLKQLYESNPFCSYCRIPLSKESVVFDHKIPLSRMGNHHIFNIAVTCTDCNQLKSSRTDDEFKLFLSEYISRFSANTEVITGTKKPVTP